MTLSRLSHGPAVPRAFRAPTTDFWLVIPGISILPRLYVTVLLHLLLQTSLPSMSLLKFDFLLNLHNIFFNSSSPFPHNLFINIIKKNTHCFLFYNFLALVQFNSSCKKLLSCSSNNIMIELSLIKIDYYHLWSLVINLNLDVSKWDFFQDLFLLWEVRCIRVKLAYEICLHFLQK